MHPATGNINGQLFCVDIQTRSMSEMAAKMPDLELVSIVNSLKTSMVTSEYLFCICAPLRTYNEQKVSSLGMMAHQVLGKFRSILV